MPATRQIQCEKNHRGFGRYCHRCSQAKKALKKCDDLTGQLKRLPPNKLTAAQKQERQTLLDKIAALQLQAQALASSG